MVRNVKNASDWPMKSPMAVRNLSAPNGYPCRFRRADYRTYRHAGADEWARLRHEQFGKELSVFYRDGRSLLMTHFCNAGSQARLRLRRIVRLDDLRR